MVADPELRALPANARIGEVVAGKFRVERVLGAGGMGVVLEATHLGLEERVALKLLHGHWLESEELGARFVREARIAAKLKSPHVVRMTDVGELEDGSPYLVMELLAGESLDAVLERERRLEPGRTCELMLQACEAVAAAHAAGVIHRDLKPANLFVTPGEEGVPWLKVLDFGISKVVTPDPLGEAALTQTQVSLGSPLYMAPEQMRSARSVDERADIWALGVILYRCLAGKSPFEADSLPQICAAVLDAEFVPLREVAPETPLELEQAVHRCLQRQPSDRFPDVAALADALALHAGETGATRAARCRRLLRASLPPEMGSTEPSARLGESLPSATGTSFAGTRARSIHPAARQRTLWAAAAVTVGGVAVVGYLVTARGIGTDSATTTAGSAAGPERPALAAAAPSQLVAVSPAPPAPSTTPSVTPDTAVPSSTTSDARVAGARTRAAPRPSAPPTERTRPAASPTPPPGDPFGERK